MPIWPWRWTRGEVFLDGAWRPLAPGEPVRVPPRAIHTFRNTEREGLRVLVWVQPAGFERFRAIGHPAAPSEVVSPPVEEADIRKLMEIADTYGLEVAGE